MDDRQLMQETLQEIQGYGGKLVSACSTINSHFQQGRKQEGIELLHQFIEGVGWVSGALYLTKPLQSERSISIDLSQLPKVLDPLVTALQNKDYGLIGDILLYEFQPMLGRWSQELEQKLTIGEDHE